MLTFSTPYKTGWQERRPALLALARTGISQTFSLPAGGIQISNPVIQKRIQLSQLCRHAIETNRI